MTKQTREYVKYDTILAKGINEAAADGTIYEDGPDEKYVVQVRKVTHYEVIDGRGTNWRESSNRSEVVLELTLAQAGVLAQALINDIAYAAEIGETRAITEEARRG